MNNLIQDESQVLRAPPEYLQVWKFETSVPKGTVVNKENQKVRDFSTVRRNKNGRINQDSSQEWSPTC